MIGSLDRLLEENLVDLIQLETSAVCIPNLLGENEPLAVLPRIIVTCQSMESPGFQETPDGIYGVFPVETTVSSIGEATNSASSSEMMDMNLAIDSVLINHENIGLALSTQSVRVFGVVTGDTRQEMSDNTLMRHRAALIWARIE